MATITTSPSPRPPHTLSPSPSLSPGVTTSPTPPPRPPSSPGISVFAPRPMRVPLYRPQNSRPVFLYDSENATSIETKEKENLYPNARRGSSASGSVTEGEGSGAGFLDNKILYSPNKDALEELYKIVRPSSSTSTPSTSTSTSQTPNPQTTSPSISTYSPRPLRPLQPQSPNTTHRRNTSDASDGGISSIFGGLSVLNTNARLNSPDNGDWRNMPVSPVARRYVGNPMVRDPSFHGETARKDS